MVARCTRTGGTPSLCLSFWFFSYDRFSVCFFLSAERSMCIDGTIVVIAHDFFQLEALPGNLFFRNSPPKGSPFYPLHSRQAFF